MTDAQLIETMSQKAAKGPELAEQTVSALGATLAGAMNAAPESTKRSLDEALQDVAKEIGQLDGETPYREALTQELAKLSASDVAAMKRYYQSDLPSKVLVATRRLMTEELPKLVNEARSGHPSPALDELSEAERLGLKLIDWQVSTAGQDIPLATRVAMARLWAENLSCEELRAVLAMHKSPAGAAERRVNAAVQKALQPQIQPILARFQLRLMTALVGMMG